VLRNGSWARLETKGKSVLSTDYLLFSTVRVDKRAWRTESPGQRMARGLV